MAVDTLKVLTFILAGGKGQRLEPLTINRPKPVVSFGGIYKIIDFTLSNCLNSNLRRIYLLVQYKSAELMRHIRDGWEMYFSPARGEFLEPVPPQYGLEDRSYFGTADAVFQNLYLIDLESTDYVLILAGDHIYKMDYRLMLESHKQLNADLTVGAVESPLSQGSLLGIIEIDEACRVIGFQEKPHNPTPLPSNPNLCFGSMGIYVFKPNILFEILESDRKDSKSIHDFGRDIIPKMISSGYKVYAFNFIDENKKTAKYWRDVGSLDTYYSTNMDLIAVDPLLNLYDKDWPVRTAPIQAPPPKFVFRDPDRSGLALDSFVSPGCIISGGKVIHSILAPFVRVEDHSIVEDSILFEGVKVGRYARIKNAIIEKGIEIPSGFEIGYNLERDKAQFLVTEENIVVVSKPFI